MKNLKEYDKHDDIEYYYDPSKIGDSLNQKENEELILDDGYNPKKKEVDNKDEIIARDNRIGIINNFYNFRKRISYIKDFDKSLLDKHYNALYIDPDLTMGDLLCNSIEYFNNNMKKYIILLEPELLVSVVEQYNICDFIYNNDRKKKYAFDMYFIQNHSITKFFTKLILYYLFNKHFAQKIKDYKKDHKEVTDVLMLVIIYRKLIEFSPSFDNCNNLK